MIKKVITRIHANEKYVWYYCFGCQHNHGVPSERWHWNESEENPTLSPSIRHYLPAMNGNKERTICHYYIENGKIKYCSDCQHNYSGKSVDMIEPTNVPENS